MAEKVPIILFLPSLGWFNQTRSPCDSCLEGLFHNPPLVTCHWIPIAYPATFSFLLSFSLLQLQPTQPCHSYSIQIKTAAT